MALVKRGGRYGVVVYRNGERKWVGTFDSKQEAQDAEAQSRLDRRSSSSLTVAQFAATWLDHYPRPKESTRIHYEGLIAGFVREWGKVQLRDLQRHRLRHWAVEHRAQAQVARAMLGDAHRDGLLADNPLAGLRLPGSRGRRDLVAPDEVAIDRLASCACFVHGEYGEQVYAPMIRFAAATGLRPGELHALRWQDVSLEQRLVVVARQYNHRVGQFTSPKNGRMRELELIPAALAALRTLHAHRMQVTGGLIFFTKQAKPFTGRVSHYYWHPVRVAFGDPSMPFYALRHAFGTMLAVNGLSAPAIAHAMGHEDGGELALKTYIHMTAATAREEVRRAFDRPQLHVIEGEAQSA